MHSEERFTEGFPDQRLVILPKHGIQRSQSLGWVSQLYITHIGAYPTAPNHYVERSDSQDNILIYCLEGKGTLTLEKETFKIGRGHAAFIPAHTSHVYQSDPNDPWSIFWVHFRGEQKETILKEMEVSCSAPLIYAPNVSAIKHRFEETYTCLAHNFSDAGLIAMSSGLMRLLSEIKLNQSTHQSGNQAIENRIQVTIKFMHQHLNVPLTLKEMATYAGLSVPHFSMLFRKRTNQSPVAYFTQIRIRKACELLLKTEEPVHAIANQLGYPDPFYFSRAFKKTQGVSPMDYRMQLE
ncbi:MAG: helix-turn-helix domain-containing protein [Opitutales bacterium]